MRASLLITCLGDMFYPEVGMAIVRLLRSLGVSVDFPAGQTCCGLPLLTSTKINLAPQLKEVDAAFLVPPAARPLAEAMKRLEAEPQLRANLGRRGQVLRTFCVP